MMASIPPPPPLPPNACHDCILQNSSPESNDDDSEGYNSILSLYDLNDFFMRTITHVKPIAQTGPNCGLTALAMVASSVPTKLSVSDIFREANSKGFTNHGEMFSALNMKYLAETFLLPWFKIDYFCDGLEVNRSSVIKRLFGGELMLIPYDADRDHSPCCSQGHKAHWAVVCGVMRAKDRSVDVAARHGKSRYMAIWSLDSLQQSNDNLAELDPQRANDDREYIIPQGGVKEGLASKFILFKRIQK